MEGLLKEYEIVGIMSREKRLHDCSTYNFIPNFEPCGWILV